MVPRAHAARQRGGAAARAQHYLVIGPWDHAGTRTPTKEVGGLAFGEASLLDLNDLHRQWYDWTMKNGPKPAFLKQRVAWYIAGPGAEEWRYADTLEAVSDRVQTLYLGANGGRAGSVFESGTLAAGKPAQTPEAAEPVRWTYDPLRLRHDNEDGGGEAYVLDQSYPLRLDGEGAVYHSAPLPAATEIAGSVKLAVWLSLDVPDTDLQALLYEIRPDGSSVYLTSDLLRARYRESLEKENLVKAGEVLRYDFTGFLWFARRLLKGSRLRLVISSVNTPGLEKNYNSGGAVADETAEDARTAHITLWHDAQHPSALEIPLAKGGR